MQSKQQEAQNEKLWLKICGFTVAEETRQAAAMGANAIGLVFAPSPRRVTLDQAVTISRQLPPEVAKVGVFVNASAYDVLQTAELAGLDTVQLHGDEPPSMIALLHHAGLRVIKALPLRSSDVFRRIAMYRNCGVQCYLLDSYVAGRAGGTGVVGNWRLAAQVARHHPVILAGGLHRGNVAQALRQVRPWGVDVSSGVEASPGRKCPEKIREFVQQIRSLETAYPSGSASQGGPGLSTYS